MGIGAIFDPVQFVGVVVLDLHEHVVDVAIAAPEELKTVAVVGDYVEA
jgi:hypothetical protein